MAIFYDYIKGCGGSAKIGTSLDNNGTTSTDIWTFLKWSDTLQYKKKSDTSYHADMHYASNNPVITFNNTPNYHNSQGWTTGRILTSEARGQEMLYDLSFKDGPGEGGWKETGSVYYSRITKMWQASNTFYTETSGWTINDSSNSNATIMHLYGNRDKNEAKIELNYPIEINNSANISGGLKVGTGVKSTYGVLCVTATSATQGVDVFGTLTSSGEASFGYGTGSTNTLTIPQYSDTSKNIQATKNLVISNTCYCSAGYFNATSDRRAKENIRKVNFSALDIVKSLSIYNFNYKNSDKPSIGVIAQEALSYNIDDFSLVENEKATGENDDYMSIKESKLIYILWKAIQEQQEEIETLKSQLRGDK